MDAAPNRPRWYAPTTAPSRPSFGATAEPGVAPIIPIRPAAPTPQPQRRPAAPEWLHASYLVPSGHPIAEPAPVRRLPTSPVFARRASRHATTAALTVLLSATGLGVGERLGQWQVAQDRNGRLAWAVPAAPTSLARGDRVILEGSDTIYTVTGPTRLSDPTGGPTETPPAVFRVAASIPAAGTALSLTPGLLMLAAAAATARRIARRHNRP